VRVVFSFGFSYGIFFFFYLTYGRPRWKQGRYGHGQVILVDDLLLVSTETGEVVLVEASPDAPRELGRLQVLEGKTWNPPALAGRYLLVRHDREAACYRLPLR
jgi:hypothetical protein